MLNAALCFARLTTVLAFSCTALVACSSGDDEGDDGPTVRVTDLAGRTCSVESASDVDCDAPPEPANGCSNDAEPCYSLDSTGDDEGPAAICAGCCSGDSSVSDVEDCSEIACTDAGDCPPSYGRCVEQRCFH